VLDRHAQVLRCLVLPEGVSQPPRRSAAEEERHTAVRQRMAERHADIHRLAAAGESIAGTARRLDIPAPRCGGIWRQPRRASATKRQTSVLDPRAAYLRQRWEAGCRNALQRWRELCERGYAGRSRPVSCWAAAQRTTPAPTTPQRHRASEDETPVPRSAGRPSIARLAWLLSGLQFQLSQLEARQRF
jgi:transposase